MNIYIYIDTYICIFCMYIYIYIRVNCNDLTGLPHWNHGS